MVSVYFQGKPFNMMVIQAYALNSNTEEAGVEWLYEHLRLIHVDIWQKPTQFCKAIILQLKNKLKKRVD